jgi:Uma2 family endonuclease
VTSSPPPSIPPGPFKLTVEDYMELPNDGKRYEILDGDLYVSPPSTPRHQRVSKRLLHSLVRALEEPGLGEVFDAPIVLDEFTVAQPDLVFIAVDGVAVVGEKNIAGPPALVVEIRANIDRQVGFRRPVGKTLGNHYEYRASRSCGSARGGSRGSCRRRRAAPT